MIFNIKKKVDLKYRIHKIPKGFLEPNREMKRLIIQQQWDDRFIEILEKEKIESINYNPYLECDIEFLEKLTNFPIRDFVLQTPTVKNIEPLRYLKFLECLSLDQPFISAPDFSEFQNLWWLGVAWRTKGKSILRSKTIRRLGLNKVSFKNLEPLAEMQQLELLGISYGSLESLEGIENLPNLTDLAVRFSRNFKSLDGLQNAPKLTKEKTIITKCKQITPESPFAEHVTFNDLV